LITGASAIQEKNNNYKDWKMMHMDFSNKVKKAVNRVGGATKIPLSLGCSGSAVFTWIRKQTISDINKAKTSET